MLKEWFKLMQWHGPMAGSAITALEAWGRWGATPPSPTELFPTATLTPASPMAAARVGTVEQPSAVSSVPVSWVSPGLASGAFASGSKSGPTTSGPTGELLMGGAYQAIENGVPTLWLVGTPDELGDQHGRLQAANIQALKSLYIDRVFPTAEIRAEALRLSHKMLDFTPPEYLTEIDALGRASGIGHDDAVLMQTFLDVMRGLACSTMAVEADATADGIPLLGRTLDFPGFGVAHLYNMVSVIAPAEPGRRAFAVFGWPGLIGPLTAMNADGLTIATLQITSPWSRLDAMPYPLMYRELISTCATVAEAEDYLRGARIGSTNNLTIMDATGAAVVAELNREGVRFRRPKGGGVIATNHFRARSHRMDVRCRRYAALARRLEADRGRLTPQRVKSALHRVNEGLLTLQSLVLKPTLRRAEFAFGPPPSTSGPYIDLDLGAYFGRIEALRTARAAWQANALPVGYDGFPAARRGYPLSA